MQSLSAPLSISPLTFPLFHHSRMNAATVLETRRATHPNYEQPFLSTQDAIKRLLVFHTIKPKVLKTIAVCTCLHYTLLWTY